MLKGAKLTLSGGSLDVPTVSYADAEGAFHFTLPSKGRFTLLVQLHGYRMEKKDIDLQMGTVIQVTMQAIPELAKDVHELREVAIMDNRQQIRQQEDALNVEVVNSDYLQRHLGGSLMKSLERLPGIKTIGIGSGQSKPLIRGLGFNRVVVVDKGVKHEGQQWGADHGLELDQFAANEVELIKGAASFVYGADAIAGAIDVKPAALPAAHTFGGSADLIGKSNNQLDGSSLNLYGRTDHWFMDARLTYQNYGDYRVPTDTIFVYDYAVRLHDRQLRNTAGRETNIHLNTGFIGARFRSVFYFSNTFSNSGFFASAHGLEPRRVDTDQHDASSRDILMPSQKVNHFKVINRTVWELSAHRLEADLGFQRNFRQEFSQYVNHGYMPPVYPADMIIPADLEREFDKHVYSANLKDYFSLGRHSITAGMNAEFQDNTINGWTFLVPSFRQFTGGMFVYDKLKINDKLLLHGALRYDYGRLRLSEYTDWFPSIPDGGTGTNAEYLKRAENLNRTFNSFVWSAGMNYNEEHFFMKANVGKSFRMPIAKELGANGVNYHYFSYERGNPALAPEQSYQADLSLGWKAPRWSVQLSPFYNYFPNYIYLNPTADHDYYYGAGNQVFRYEQSRVMRYGAELQLQYEFLRGLSAELLGEYLYARQLSGDKKGYTLPFSPPASVLFNLSWLPMKDKGSYISVDYRVTGRQDRIVPPEKKTAGYRLLNLQAGTKTNVWGQPVQLSLQVQNLLDTRYLNHTSFYRLIELPEAGRNIVLSLKVPFSGILSH